MKNRVDATKKLVHFHHQKGQQSARERLCGPFWDSQQSEAGLCRSFRFFPKFKLKNGQNHNFEKSENK